MRSVFLWRIVTFIIYSFARCVSASSDDNDVNQNNEDEEEEVVAPKKRASKKAEETAVPKADLANVLAVWGNDDDEDEAEKCRTAIA